VKIFDTNINFKEISFNRVINAFFKRITHPYYLFKYYLPFGFNKSNRKKISKLKNIHNGKRCFIIASGPSLKHIDFNFLKNEYTIAMNRGYMLEDQVGLKPNYLVCIDIKTQLKQFTNEYNNIKGITTFYNYNMKHLFDKFENRYFIQSKFSSKFIGKNMLFGNGKSVTYHCIQLAHYMGFSEVYLIGKDHSYDTSQIPGSSVKVTKKTNNHFLKNYYYKNQIYDSPDLMQEEIAYKIAKDFYEKTNRKIYDATINGKLDIFDKIDFFSLFQKTI
tara:strand:- start:654 stop:1478 length:825 start_codon:yes stop_codon:yes gene_type:complete